MLITVLIVWAVCVVAHIAATYVFVSIHDPDPELVVWLSIIGGIFAPLSIMGWLGLILGMFIKNNYFGD